MLDQRPGFRAVFDFVNAVYFRRVPSPGLVIPADVNYANLRPDKLIVAYDPVKLLIGEKLDYLARFELERIA